MKDVIKSTTDYGKFELFPVNRTVNPSSARFKNLLESMKEHGWLSPYPMHCVKNGNGTLQIKAGHNRFKAAQILGMPVKYVVENDKADIYSLEQAGPGKWANKDYLDSFCKKGIHSYLIIQEYMNRTGISLQHTASMFYGQTAGSGNFVKDGKFQQGKFTIKDYKHPQDVADIVLELKSIGVTWSNDSKFVNSLSKCLKVPSFSKSRFLDKSRTFPQLFEKKKNVQDYMKLIELVYNYKAHRKDKSNIAFYAEELAKARQVSGLL